MRDLCCLDGAEAGRLDGADGVADPGRGGDDVADGAGAFVLVGLDRGVLVEVAVTLKDLADAGFGAERLDTGGRRARLQLRRCVELIAVDTHRAGG